MAGFRVLRQKLSRGAACHQRATADEADSENNAA